MPLAPYALTDFATVSAIPGLTTISQAFCEQLINQASSKIASFCNRQLHYTTFTIADPDKVRSYDGVKLKLSVYPIALGGTINTPPGGALASAAGGIFHGCVTQVTQLNWPEDAAGQYLVPQDQYEFDGQSGAESGILYMANGWTNSGQLEPGLNFTDRVSPGSEEATNWAVYSGGYITKPQAYGGAGVPVGTQWPWTANTLTALGTLLLTGAAPNQVLWQSVPNGLGLSTGDSADTTSSMQPVFPIYSSAGLAIGTQVADNTVSWMCLGLAGAPGFAGVVSGGSCPTVLLGGSEMRGGARITLPDDLEQACIKQVLAWFRDSGRDPTVKSQTLLGSTQSFYDVDPSGLCAAARALAMPYAEIH